MTAPPKCKTCGSAHWGLAHVWGRVTKGHIVERPSRTNDTKGHIPRRMSIKEFKAVVRADMGLPVEVTADGVVVFRVERA